MDRGVHIPSCPFHPVPTFAKGTVQAFEHQFLSLYSFEFVLIFGFLNMLCYLAKSSAAQQTISAVTISERWLN